MKDWDFDYGTNPDNVIDAYIAESTSTSQNSILDELNALIDRYKDTDPPDNLSDLLGCIYAPERQGWTQIAWLKHVRDKIQAAVKG